MANGILLSVIVPVYNTSALLLKRAIRSLTVERPQSVELVFVDDGSNPSTASLLDSLVDGIDDAFVIHQKNGGQNAARENGVLHANGEYIAFCDSDDEFHWSRMGNIIRILRRSEVDAVAFNGVQINDNTGKVQKYDFTNITTGLDNDNTKRILLSQCAEVWRHIFRRSILTPDIFCKESRIGEDLAIVFLALARANTIKYDDQEIYRYHVHDSGIEHSIECNKRLKITDAFDFIRDHLSMEDRENYQAELEWQAIWHVQFYEPLAILQSNCKKSERRICLKQLSRWMDHEYPNWKNNRYLADARKSQDLRFRLILERRYYLYSVLRRLRSFIDTYTHRNTSVLV